MGAGARIALSAQPPYLPPGRRPAMINPAAPPIGWSGICEVLHSDPPRLSTVEPPHPAPQAGPTSPLRGEAAPRYEVTWSAGRGPLRLDARWCGRSHRRLLDPP